MNRVSISVQQMIAMLIPVIVSAGHFLFVRLVLIYCGHSGWMTIFPSIVIGFLAFAQLFYLIRKYPQLTLIEITIVIYGKILGRIVALAYLLFFMVVADVIIRAIGDFLTSAYPYTPYAVLTSVIVLISAFAVRKGIEVVARSAQLVLPVLIVLGILASVLTAKDKHFEYILPLWPINFSSFLQGTILLSGLFCEVVVAGMLLSNVVKVKNGTKTAAWFYIAIGVMFIGPLTGPPMVFGESMSYRFNYPTYEEIRYIQFTNFLERLDVVGILLWGIGSFLKLSVFIFAISLGIAQWIGLKDYRPVVYPLSIVLLIQASGFVSNRAEFWGFLSQFYPFSALSVGLILPMITILIARLRNWTKSVRA